MSEKNTTIRSLHDLGLAAWFGGSLMGAVGLNGAAAQATDPQERVRLSSIGWKRWAPASAAAITAHAVGGAGLIRENQARVQTQPGARANTLIKAGVTVAAAAVTAYSGFLGRQVEEQSHEGGAGATEPRPGASEKLKQAQSRLRATQWAIPALTGVALILGAQQGEQQRPQSLVANRGRRLAA